MKSLFFRTYLAVIAFALVSFFLILTFVIDPAIEHDSWEYSKEDAAAEYEALQELLKDVPEEQWLQKIEEYETEYFKDVQLTSIEEIDNKTHRQQLSKPGTQRTHSSFEDYPWFVHIKPSGSTSVITISDFVYDETDTDESTLLATSFSERLETYLPWILISVAQLLGVILVVRLIKSPVDKLVETTEKFGAGDFTARANTDAPEPLAKLAKRFNFMADQVEQSLNDKEAMIAAIPHELQTPLSRLRFLLELSKKKDTVSALRASMDDIEENFDELENAVSEILELIRIKNTKSEDQISFNMLSLLKPIAGYYSNHDSISMELECPEELEVNAHDELLSRAIHNLIQNAQKYAKSKCLLSAHVSDGRIIVTVEDDGPGIPELSRKKLLAAFSRLDHSRSEGTGGLGLGLALVKTIMDQHHGAVDIGESQFGGALVALNWPIKIDS